MYALIVFLLVFYTSMSFALSDTIVPPITVQKPLEITFSNAPKKVITAEDITTIGATSVPQILQMLGGIQLQDTTGNGSQVLLSMRGFGANASSNTLILVNGIPIVNPDIAPPDLNFIPIQEIDRIEIITGSESVLYGDQAVGGVVNIITKKPTSENIVLSCAMGSFNQHNCYGAINHSFKKINYNIAALTHHTNGYRDHNDYDQNLLSGNFLYDNKASSIVFDYQIAKEIMQYPGALTAEEAADNPRQASNHTDFFSDWSGNYHLQQKQLLNPNWQLTTDLARREMHGNGVLTSPFTQSRITHFLKPQLTGTFRKNIVTTGMDLEDDRYHLGTDFGITQDALQKYGVFSLINLPVKEPLIISVGGRAAIQKSQLQDTSQNHTLNRAATTTLGILYKLSLNHEVYLRHAGSFRFPKADEMASSTTPLKTQKGYAYEAGLRSHFLNLISEIAIYQLNLTDEIAFDPEQTAKDPFGTNRNLPPTIRQGFSLSEKYIFTKKLILNTEYHYVNARFQSGINSGNRIPLVAENIVHLGANYLFHPHWNLYIEALFTGNQYPANDDANIGNKIGGYTIYNSNLGYIYKQLKISFKINNIFNKNYFLYTVFDTSNNTSSFYPAAGRNILLTLTYSFL